MRIHDPGIKYYEEGSKNVAIGVDNQGITFNLNNSSYNRVGAETRVLKSEWQTDEWAVSTFQEV